MFKGDDSIIVSYSMKETIEYLESKKRAGKSIVVRKELVEYFKTSSPKINPSTINSRIFDLKKSRAITEIDNSLYLIGYKRQYRPSYSKFVYNLTNEIVRRFPYLDRYCVWDTEWLSEFTILQSNRSIVTVEVERETEEAIFEYLSNLHKDVYIKPSKKEVEKYILPAERSIVIKPIISNSPLIRERKLSFPKLEKILVDLYCEQNLYIAYQDGQLASIYRNSEEKYVINRKIFRAYAKRRRREKKLREFLHKNNINTLPEYVDKDDR